MSKLRTFFYVFWNSLFSPAYYAHIARAPLAFSLKFFFLYTTLYAFVATAWVYISLVGPMGKMLRVLPSRLKAVYPQELTVTIKNGTVTTNVKEPFVIPLKSIEETLSDIRGEVTDQVEHLIVIDTNAEVEDYTTLKTIILLTKQNLVIPDDNGTIKVVPLTEIKDFTINRSLVDRTVNMLTPYLRYFLPIIGFSVLVWFAISLPVGLLLYLLFFGLIAMALTKLRGVALSYGKVYRLGLHLIILPTTFTGLFTLLGKPISTPFLRTVIMTIALLFVLGYIKKKSRSR